MRTKLLVPVALAVAVGFSSWYAGAASPYPEVAPVVTTKPAYESDMQAAKSPTSGPQTTVYVSKSFGEPAPSAVARPASSDRAVKSGVGPAMMFQLRENAGG